MNYGKNYVALKRKIIREALWKSNPFQGFKSSRRLKIATFCGLFVTISAVNFYDRLDYGQGTYIAMSIISMTTDFIFQN